MIGDMLAKIRKEKGMTKTELAKLTNINIGHLTHIEKGERNPSYRTLKILCRALNIPYQQLMYTYDKELSEDQYYYKATSYISYNRILAVNNIDNIEGFIECPPSVPGAALAIKVQDDAMTTSFDKGAYAYVELNTPLNPKEIGLFSYNGKILIRKFSLRRGRIVLRAENKAYEEIEVQNSDDFYIIGKIVR